MIKRLKTRFIILNMSIVASIVACLFTFICVFTCNVQRTQTLKSLELAISKTERKDFMSEEEFTPNHDFEHKNPRPDRFEMPNIYAFCIHFDKSNNFVKFDGENTISEEYLSQLANEVLSTKKTTGKADEGTLMFLKKNTPSGTVIAFTSTEMMNASIRSTVLICLWLCIGSLIIFFIISVILAHYAVKPVKSAWDSQTQFVADASHDLKTPLTVILANNDIIMSHKDENVQSQQKWLESTREEVLKMKGLVTQMLDLAKSENAHSLSFSKVDLSEITEGEILQLEPVAFEKQLTICSNISRGIFINTNKEAYLRIVQVLLDNAIKYSKEHEEIDISLREDRQRAYLFVNSPSFIKKETLAHIFERFYRGDQARSDGGYGLGLAIAKNLAISINGELGVKSTLEEGTTFLLALKKK